MSTDHVGEVKWRLSPLTLNVSLVVCLQGSWGEGGGREGGREREGERIGELHKDAMHTHTHTHAHTHTHPTKIEFLELNDGIQTH